MKIVYIGNNLKRGNPTTLQNLSALLSTVGYRIKVYGTSKNKFLRILEMVFGVCKNYKATYVLIDTYSTTNFYYALIISQLCRCLGVSYIPILHGGNLPVRLKKNPLLSKLIFKNSYNNSTPSLYLETEFNNQGYETVYIPNPMQLESYKFKKRSHISLKLLWVRAFDEIYNPNMAIEVVSELKKRGITAYLSMVGPDKDGSFADCKELAIKLGVENKIEFTGYLSKEKWVQKAANYDIFINTTTVDNIPVSVLEAMTLGLPVISTNVGGIPYLIKDKFNGFLVENNNVDEMVASVLDLTKMNSSDINILIDNARVTAENCDEGKVLKKWQEILK
ncbi:Glycosyltransferase involved in cell wall bisynthesis [Lutibacter oricola]|uniref:Glycosyltransferase involved in cell wall bisynthesis n=1 Tax=Lutibacter oricola TaxID=762486 RepID=A0A1H2X232_9FLAO|nr:Glycosyltransferase involved in cell wall bisynthesis [Lutibacter oricola]